MPPSTPSRPRRHAAASTIRESPLRPECPARNRLRLWRPLHARSLRDHYGAQVPLTDDDLDRIFSVVGGRWEASTRSTYGSGLALFHVWCRDVPEAQRCPVSHVLLLAFLAACAGSYSGSALRNILHSLRAWHVLHGQPWNGKQVELEAALTGASRLAPPQSRRPKRAPFTPAIISKLRDQLDLTTPLDAAFFACLTTTFWSAARLGEFTVPTLSSFEGSRHVKRSDVSHGTHPAGGAPVTVFHLPHTKCSEHGEDVYWAAQSGPADPLVALDNHFRVNAPMPSEFLFTWVHSSGKRRPLTRSEFLKRLKSATLAAGLEPLQGHGLRIGAVLEYLLRKVPFDVVKVMGRWSSDAFILYLRQHAVVIAPYIQDTPLWEDFARLTLPPVR